MEQLIYSPMYTKASSADGRSVEATLSSETVDGHGEIVDQSSWKLDRYRKNPVVLYMHDVYSPIGHAENVRVDGGRLQAKIVFSTTSLASMVAKLFQSGALRAFSVGFRVGRVSQETVNGVTVRRLLDPELMETSAVSIPSNPDAVVRCKSLGLLPPNFTVDVSKDLADEALRLAKLTPEQREAGAIESLMSRCGIGAEMFTRDGAA